MKKTLLLTLFLAMMTVLCPVTAEESGPVLIQYQTYNTIQQGSTLDIAAGMGYILKASDGSLFVIDGGLAQDGYHFLQLLKEVSGQEKPHVAMWFLSHPHSDHYGALYNIACNYMGELEIDTVLANFPPSDTVDTVKSTSYAPGQTALDTILWTFKAQLQIPHTGETYQAGDISLDVVTTWEDLKQINEVNETSTVLMAYAGGQKILFLGDAYAATCRNAMANYGDRIDCDIVQVAHHAVCGGTADLYKATGAQLYLIANNRATVDITRKKDNVVYWVVKNAPEMLYAGDGTSFIPLPYEAK